MKNNALFASLFILLGIQAGFTQQSLPAGVRPYAENWTWSIVKSLHRAGFDMPSMPASIQPAGLEPHSGSLQLDSTKTFYGYSASPAGDSTPMFRTIYEYPAAHLEIELEYQFDNGDWLALSRATQTRDAQGRLVDVFAEAFDPGTQEYRNDSRLDIFPHGDSPELLDSVFTYQWDAGTDDWSLVFSMRNVYDSQDRLLEVSSSVDYLGDTLIFLDVYSYDANGDNHRIDGYAILDGEVFHGSITQNTFVDHRVIETLVKVSDGSGFVPESRENLAYHLSGQLRQVMSFRWDAEKGNMHLDQTVKYAYYNDGRLSTKETSVTPLNAWEERGLVVYAYVEGEDLWLETTLRWDDDRFDWVMDGKKYFYYDGLVAVDPTPRPAQPLQAFPNPTTGVVRLPFSAGAAVRVFDPSGQLIQTRLLQPGQTTLDLTLLPAGIYSVSAVQDGAVYSGKIVKQ